MDNRKMYKKIATLFWWILTALPLIVALLYFIGYHFAFNNGMATAVELASYHDDGFGNFYNFLDVNEGIVYDFGMSNLTDMFQNLFRILGVADYVILGSLFGYMLSIQVYHLLFDCLVFFIHLIHNFMDKFNNEMY